MWGCTLVHFNALNGFIVHRRGAGLDELVALDAQIDNLCTLNRQLDELLHHIVHDLRCGLRRQKKRQ